MNHPNRYADAAEIGPTTVQAERYSPDPTADSKPFRAHDVESEEQKPSAGNGIPEIPDQEEEETDTPVLRFKGTPVFMDGQEWLIPSLSVTQFRAHYEQLMKAEKATPETLGSLFQEIVPIVLMAVRRNYPRMTASRFENMVDLGSFQEVLTAVCNQSGMKQTKPGEFKPAIITAPAAG